MELLLPLGVAATVEVLAKADVPTDQALSWLAQGYTPDAFPDLDVAPLDPDARRLLQRIDRHRILVASIRKEEADAREADAGLRGATDRRERTTHQANLEQAQAAADLTWLDLRVHRAHMLGAGQVPPALPADLAAREQIDQAREQQTASRRGDL